MWSVKILYKYCKHSDKINVPPPKKIGEVQKKFRIAVLKVLKANMINAVKQAIKKFLLISV